MPWIGGLEEHHVVLDAVARADPGSFLVGEGTVPDGLAVEVDGEAHVWAVLVV